MRPSLLPLFLVLVLRTSLTVGRLADGTIIFAATGSLSAFNGQNAPQEDGLTSAYGLRFFEWWVNEVYGGIRLNGSRVKVSLLLKDDHSDPTVVAPVYTYFHTYKEADLFFAPFYEPLIDAAEPLLNSWQKPWINIGASSSRLEMRNNEWMFAISTPLQENLQPCFDLILEKEPKTAVMLTRNSTTGREQAGYVRNLFRGRVSILADDYYAPNATSDQLLPLLQGYRDLQPDLLIAGGTSSDGAVVMGALWPSGLQTLTPKLVFIYQVASQPSFMIQNDWKSMYVVSNAPWSYSFGWNCSFFGTSTMQANSAFRDMFVRQMQREPSYHSAFAVSGGLVLLQAIEAAQSLDPLLLRDALRQGTFDSLVGPIEFSASTILAPERSAGCVQVQPGPGPFSNVVHRQNVAVPGGVGNVSALIYDTQPVAPQDRLYVTQLQTTDPIAIGLLTVSIASLVLFAATAVLLAWKRHHPVVRFSTWPSISAVLLGLCMLVGSVIALAVTATHVNCVIRHVLEVLSIPLVFGATLAKLIRFYRLRKRPAALSGPIGTTEFLTYLAWMLSLQLVFLLVWVIAFRPDVRSVTTSYTGFDSSVYVQCGGQGSFVFALVEKGILLGYLLVSAILHILVHRLSSRVGWGEMLYLPLQIYGTALMAGAAIAILITVRQSPSIHALAFGICLLTIALINYFAMFGRKLFLIFYRSALFEDKAGVDMQFYPMPTPPSSQRASGVESSGTVPVPSPADLGKSAPGSVINSAAELPAMSGAPAAPPAEPPALDPTLAAVGAAPSLAPAMPVEPADADDIAVMQSVEPS
jgi:branched-chain amino acid transport system substrate-binding protein